MKRITVLSLIFVVAALPIMMALSIAGVQSSLTWSIQTVDSAGDVGMYSSLGLDSLGRPFMSYYDATNGNLKFANTNGTAWTIVTLDWTGDVGAYTSMARDSVDISYYDATNGDLKYVKWTPTGWIIQTVDSAGDVGSWTSIALDSLDRPHISYHDATNGDLKYAWWTGSAWSIQTVDSEGDVGLYTSIALTSNDWPRISYYDATNSDLKWAQWEGTAWNVMTLNWEGDVGLYTSVALDSLDRPHISHHDATNSALMYTKWTVETDWISVTLDRSVGWPYFVGLYTSITLDSWDIPHISYYAGKQEWMWEGYGDLKYVKWTPTGWSIQTVDLGGYVGKYTSVALDSSDRPHISYYDDTNGNLKYAATAGDFSVSVSPSSQTVAAGGSTAHTVTVTYLSGTPDTVSLSLNLPQTVGSYTFTPQSGTPTFTSKLTITTIKTAPPGTYDLTITATGMGRTETTALTLTVTAPPTLTLDINPSTVAKGQQVTFSGQLTPARTTTIRLYYRFPHETGTWKLVKTLTTTAAGAYSWTVTIPTTAPTGQIDFVAVWFDESTGTYTASPIMLLIIT